MISCYESYMSTFKAGPTFKDCAIFTVKVIYRMALKW